MKKTLALLCVALVLLAMTACKNGYVASPSPKLTVRPTNSPIAGATDVLPSPSPTAGLPASPGPTGGGTIEGFVEGGTVEVNALPSTVTAAVSKEYPGATIKSASYATHMNEQMYLLTLSGAADKTEKIYVKADGTIVPFAEPSKT